MEGIRCVHYIEQKDCTAGLHGMGILIPYTKVNQVHATKRGKTVQCTGEGPSRYTYSICCEPYLAKLPISSGFRIGSVKSLLEKVRLTKNVPLNYGVFRKLNLSLKPDARKNAL